MASSLKRLRLRICTELPLAYFFDGEVLLGGQHAQGSPVAANTNPAPPVRVSIDAVSLICVCVCVCVWVCV